MNQNYKTGPAKSLKVFPGDVVELEVWAYFEASSGFGTTSAAITTLVTCAAGVFGGSPTPGDPGNAVYNGVDAAYGAFGAAPNLGDSQPSAYLNYIMFDKEFNVLDMGWKPVPATANFSRQRVFFDPIQIKEAGFIYTYLSYEGESDQYVYFDDFKVTHTKTSVLQYSDYYAFGLSTENSWARDNANNNFLYNEGSELNKTSGFYDLPFRNYDAALGRFFQVDPLSHWDPSTSPFAYVGNNPVSFSDPTGLMMDAGRYFDSELRAIYRANMWRYGSSSFDRWAQDNVSGTSLDGTYYGGGSSGAGSGDGGAGGWVSGQSYTWVNNPSSTDPDAGYWDEKTVYFYVPPSSIWGPTNYGGGATSGPSGGSPSPSSPQTEGPGDGPGGDNDPGGPPSKNSERNWLSAFGSMMTIWGIATEISVSGPKPINLGKADWANQVKAGTKFGKVLGAAGLLMTGADMAANGVNTSNSLDAFFGGVSFAGPWGAAAGTVYFIGNLITTGITGETIGEHIDNNFYVISTGLPGTPFIFIPKRD